ncbi:tRNA (adenosine(37)-N6)-threonylcarbamoyltransferase complex dimerization subunit type 1 TsaB [Frankia sp. AgB1.9]|nr:tRNA (adenosine(37)-N6)-threonylcarbamoyltransferase complex dimerization subunit type 1 TsaB [Frankia sp. AgW1.1]MBL7553425.1 tRNA (adenosine(37)-N6)-threonylcarbamoyltransferase complex dimerization subunit type 1 TsaB [Frankia sp. AgB1.9]MBL7623288.1 tRNA (adenosine(37)-N6)-threonylcarbamoyltransferase complex dimerization subunit type 1 TsaB [Frankia sp. AgB1.8]
MLAVDTSTPACSVALVELGPAPSFGPAPSSGPASSSGLAPSPGPGRLLAARRVVDARRHGELLAPLIQTVLAEAAVRPAALSALVVGLGPGPFTSLRVGIVTAGTFAAALGLPCHGVCSLDGIGAATTGQAGVAIDARRREVFWAGYADGRRIAGPSVDYPVRAAELLRAAGVDTLAGPGRELYPDAFTSFAAASAGLAPSVPDYPDPALLAALAAADLRAGRAPEPLTPIYLRRPDVAEPHPAKPVRA